MAWVEFEGPATRWLLYVAATLLVGIAGATWILRPLEPVGTPDLAARDAWNRRLRGLLILTGVLLAIASLLMIVAQVRSWFGPEATFDYAQYRLIADRTQWGHGWRVTAVLALVALALTCVPASGRGALWLSALTGLVAGLAVPQTGHGGSQGPLLRCVHSAHVIGGGLWIGTLAALMWATHGQWVVVRPETRRRWLARLSVVALTGAATMGLSGLVLTSEHAGLSFAMTRTSYGLTLLTKVAVTAVIAALGWRNWRRLGPRVEDATARRALLRAAVAEIGLGVIVVLALASWLSGLPMPLD